MKKLTLLLLALLGAFALQAQIPPSDASAFLSRNPLSQILGVKIFGLLETDGDNVFKSHVEWEASEPATIRALDSGFQLMVKVSDGSREKFVPYSSIKYLLLSGEKYMIFHLFD